MGSRLKGLDSKNNKTEEKANTIDKITITLFQQVFESLNYFLGD